MRARAKFDFNLDASGVVYLREAASVTLYDKTGYRGPREHKRLYLLEFPGFAQLATNVISLALNQLEYTSGYIAFEIFRTFDDVVYGFHQDGEHFVGLFCINRHCEGAITQLSTDKAGKDLIFNQKLEPGDLLFFRDSQVFHYTGSLEPQDKDNKPYRDALIITMSGIIPDVPGGS